MTAVQQPSGTVTLVFTDIEGSTRLLEELGTEPYREALAEHRRIVREACARHNGYEVDCEGDAFFYAFATAAAAVAAVTETMQGLNGGPIRIRVGIHAGQPALDGAKYVGMDVHRAARIMSSAHGGQVVLSSTTVTLLEPGTVAFKPLGEHRLKDLSTPVALTQLVVKGLPGEFPPLKTLHRSNLPIPATPFIGRETEAAEVVERLTDPDTRLLTLTGPGGTGKTRLALQAAADAADHYPDGITWIPLAPLRDPALLLATIATTLELGDALGETAEQIAVALDGKRALLLLDNLEQLMPEAATDIARLVDACPALRLLVTSRERLDLRGEREYSVGELTADDARALLSDRAAALAVAVTHDAATDKLLERLDRLPLAIELAAARLKLFSPAQLLERLAERLDLLRGGRDADPRQNTLRATIDWSYELLDENDRRLLRRLAVFPGGCGYTAAESIAGAHPDTVQSLLDKSLLRRRDSSLGPRFWMLETIREYATEQLRASGEHDTIAALATTWFCALAESPERHAWSAPPARVDALEVELDNFRAVFERLVDAGDATRALRLATDLWALWEDRDRIVEGDTWLERALALEQAAETVERGVAYDARSGTADYLGRPEDARRYSAEAVRILSGLGAEAQLAMALQGQAAAEHDRNVEAAVVLAERALELARRAGDVRVERVVLINLGVYERDRGEYARARALLEAGSAISLELGDVVFAKNASIELADLELDLGNVTAAWDLYTDVARSSLDHQSPHLLGMAVGGLAACTAGRGEEVLASRLWAAFESWESERGHRLQETRRARYERGVTSASLTDCKPALTLREAVALATTDINDRHANG